MHITLQLFQSEKKTRNVADDVSVFNSPGRLSFSKSVTEHGKWRFGLKHKKCLAVPYGRLLSSITGNFVADRLNGRVIVEFADGTALLGHARDNSLVGPKLHYSMEPVKLLNITSQEGRVHIQHSYGNSCLITTVESTSETSVAKLLQSC